MKRMIGKREDEPGTLMSPSNPVTNQNVGGDLSRPSLMGPGNKIQMIDMGNKTTKPGFKFPSSMWTE